MYNRYIPPAPPPPQEPPRAQTGTGALGRWLHDLLPKEGQAEDLLLLVLLLLLAREENETELLLTLGLIILMGLD
ncbi:MAG TPA: hypothetical protein H9841_07070 [Candidatus Flavonifractor merdigallinarum]|uniref:Uncharacterized protein n=1 Tax=Candidatus Flavonifractor merdigallinarum TaxID=2838589 RepID=A0A9D1YC52_9FIRM|nr:hypothetical protein [Candidatus Flavonifractor merdigallinarum]